MKNIMRIFRGDLAHATKNVIGAIVLVGLIVVPALYAWFNIAGSWDPYENTGDLKVAVANEDKGHQSDLIPLEVNMGDSVVSALRANDQFDWVFVDEDAAVEGVRSGKYYAAIVIPESFSADMMTLFSADIKHSSIIYYSNEKENAIAPRVTEKGASSIQESIDQTFAKTVAEIGLKTTNDLLSFMDEGEVGSYISALDRQLSSAIDLLGDSSARMSSFASLIGSTASLMESTSAMLGSTQGSSADALDAIASSKSGLTDVRGALGDLVETVRTAFDRASIGYDEVAASIDKALGDLAVGSTSAAASLNEASDEIQGLIDGMVQIRDALAAAEPDSPVLAEFDRSIELQRSLKNRVDEMAQTLSGASGDIDGQRAEIADLVAQAKQSVSDVQWGYAAQLEDELAKLGNSLDDIASSSAGIADGLDGVAAGLSGVSGSLSGDLASAKAALEEAAEALGSSADKLDAARSSLRGAAESGDVEEIKRIVGSDVSTMAQFLAAPVREDRRAVYAIANNGSAMAAFYTILSLWVGAVILVAMLKVGVSDRRVSELEDAKPYQLYLGRFGMFSLLSFLQATVVCLGDVFFLGIQCEHPFLFMLAGWIAGFVFCNLIYTLTVSFGDVGKAVAVVLLVMQVAGSGGTFPIEMSAGFFQAVYPFLPFTHGIAAMHACIGGIYGNEYWVEIGTLLLFLIPSLLLGLVLRNPVIRLNRFVIERLEQTKLM
ncbi:YhgE/Pip domain-containing protein [Raoultibacter massiliensis]|uniref:YhgE/Pip domain-containing protein n=1 Tax=Raoultibacter massiliensis TaxID=1852371 RepID=A0ABV1J9Q6_9ACTN|nr:YhgE/Pip domain-containing protein [Raoultibacter massiliensis]